MQKRETRQLKILAPTRYPWRFNSPRQSRHSIDIRNFIPFNKISPKIEGFTVFAASPFARYDLIHAFNRIPVGRTPFVIGCEAHLPRAFGLEKSGYYRLLNRTLAGDRCRRIVAISRHATRVLAKQHADDPDWNGIAAKLEIRYPNMVIPAAQSDLAPSFEPVRLVFVGSHFGRKGGAVAVKMAEKAKACGFPLHVTIISDLTAGGAVWTDPVDRSLFDPYLKLLELDNVEHLGSLGNAEVQKHLKAAHFSILTTFSDTFGYSAIESMAHGTPVIATKQGALPEFIEDDLTGVLLDIDTNDVDEWVAIVRDRSTPDFAKYYFDEIDRLADEALASVMRLTASPDQYRQLRQRALEAVTARFNHIDANAYWDDLYEKALQR